MNHFDFIQNTSREHVDLSVVMCCVNVLYVKGKLKSICMDDNCMFYWKAIGNFV